MRTWSDVHGLSCTRDIGGMMEWYLTNRASPWGVRPHGLCSMPTSQVLHGGVAVRALVV